MTRNRKNERGFSLIEMAIVMSVIGIMMSGLWVIFGNTSESMRQHSFAADMTGAVNGIRGAYMNKAAMPSANAQATTLYLLGLKTALPAHMSGPGNTIVSPWGGVMYVCAWVLGSTTQCLPATATGPAPTFAIEAQGLPQASCINAVVRSSDSSMPSGLVDVYVNTASVGLGAAGGPAVPITAANAMAGCKNAASNTVDFVYRLNPSTAP